MLSGVVSGFMAGILISIGGTVYLMIDNNYIGAVFFSVALLCICFRGYALFTGRIGFVPYNHKKSDITLVLSCLLGNAVATVLCGFVLRFVLSKVGNNAEIICTNKLLQSHPETLIRAVFCGILMYLAVSIYKENNKNIIGILFCIPVFILSGFEHSIADMFYFAAANSMSLKVLIFILLVLIGNTFGGMLLPLLEIVVKRLKKERSNNVV